MRRLLVGAGVALVLLLGATLVVLLVRDRPDWSAADRIAESVPRDRTELVGRWRDEVGLCLRPSGCGADIAHYRFEVDGGACAFVRDLAESWRREGRGAAAVDDGCVLALEVDGRLVQVVPGGCDRECVTLHVFV